VVRELRGGMILAETTGKKAGEKTGEAAGKKAGEKAEVTGSGLPQAGVLNVQTSAGRIRHRGLLKVWSVTV